MLGYNGDALLYPETKPRTVAFTLPEPTPEIPKRTRKGIPRPASLFDGREDEVCRLSKSMSLSQLACHFQCSEATISRIKRKLGVRSEKRVMNNSKYITHKKEFLALHNSLPDKDLAKHFGVYIGTIEKWRVKLEVRKAANRWELSPHPRGANGIRLSKNARETISKKASAWWKSLSQKERSEFTLRGLKTREKNGTLYPPRNATTWKAGWREIGGQRIYCRSAWEANFARYLEFLRNNGDISGWKHEPETFWFDAPKKTAEGKYLKGIRRGVVSYLPDFVVTEKNGDYIYYEVKGWMDKRSKTKLDRMRLYYPEVKLILIDAKQYKSITKAVSGLIDDWERGVKCRRADQRTEVLIEEIV